MLGISTSGPLFPVLFCRKGPAPRASTPKALGKGSHPYIHPLQCLQHWVPPSAQAQEEPPCYPAPTQGTRVATDCHSAVPSVPWGQTLGWGTAHSSPSPEESPGSSQELLPVPHK